MRCLQTRCPRTDEKPHAAGSALLSIPTVNGEAPVWAVHRGYRESFTVQRRSAAFVASSRSGSAGHLWKRGHTGPHQTFRRVTDWPQIPAATTEWFPSREWLPRACPECVGKAHTATTRSPHPLPRQGLRHAGSQGGLDGRGATLAAATARRKIRRSLTVYSHSKCCPARHILLMDLAGPNLASTENRICVDAVLFSRSERMGPERSPETLPRRM